MPKPTTLLILACYFLELTLAEAHATGPQIWTYDFKYRHICEMERCDSIKMSWSLHLRFKSYEGGVETCGGIGKSLAECSTAPATWNDRSFLRIGSIEREGEQHQLLIYDPSGTAGLGQLVTPMLGGLGVLAGECKLKIY